MRENSELANQQVFAVDLGGTFLRIALVDRCGKIHHQLKQRTPRGDSPDVVVDALASVADRWITDGRCIAAASIMVPGTVDNDNAVVVQAPNLPALSHFPLKAVLEERLGWAGLSESAEPRTRDVVSEGAD